MTKQSDAHIAEVAEAAAREAGSLVRNAFEEAATGHQFAIEEKHGHTDLVTALDRQSEVLIKKRIFEQVPGSAILGEENGWEGEGDLAWYVDPIDGTTNFASGLPFYCVSIAALTKSGLPIAGVVYDPMRDEMFTAHSGQLFLNGNRTAPARRAVADRDAVLLTNLPREGQIPSASEQARFGALLESFRGVRRMGSAALQLAWVAVGRVTASYDEGCSAWDIAAGMQLVLAGGGQIRAWTKDEGKPIDDPLRDLNAKGRLLASIPGFDVENSAALFRP